MAHARITDDDRERFLNDGFVVKRRCFDEEEVGFVRRALIEDATLRENVIDRQRAFGLPDREWEASDRIVQTIWNEAGDDLFGAISRCARLVEGAELLLGGEVYNYTHALNVKPAGGGGSFRWHQDYGYWYENGILFPDMLNAVTAIDPAQRDSGCIQVLKGSQRMGRVRHVTDRGQKCADPQRVAWARSVLELVHVEMEPGDVMFQHCNTLHGSEPNTSRSRRALMVCSYNRASNNPFLAHHHNNYRPLEKLPDRAVKEHGRVLEGARRGYIGTEGVKTHEAGEREQAVDVSRPGGDGPHANPTSRG